MSLRRPRGLPWIAGLSGLVSVLLLTGCSGNKPDVVPISSDSAWFQKKAQESKGDFSKLSPADQQKAIDLAGPNAAEGIRRQYVPSAKDR